VSSGTLNFAHSLGNLEYVDNNGDVECDDDDGNLECAGGMMVMMLWHLVGTVAAGGRSRWKCTLTMTQS